MYFCGMEKLKSAIKSKGVSYKWFAENILGMQYQLFKYHMDNRSFKVNDINKMLAHLDCTYEELFRNEPSSYEIKK
jgi:hypothetical protein